jgi:thiamine biosynthesis protein ThiS
MKKMSKKKCFVNGASFTIKNCCIQLEDLITTTVGKEKNQLSLAVAVNNELVQKSKWKSKVIKEGDVIEIVQPFFGG